MTNRRWGKWIFWLLVLPGSVVVATWQGWAWWSWASGPAAPEVSSSESGVQIQIPTGTPGQQIGQDLEAAGVIRSALAWRLWSRWQGLTTTSGGFQAGTYVLSPTEPLGAIARTIWEGQVVQESFTIPEGWNRQQMADYFEQEGYFAADRFLAATAAIPQDVAPWLPEGLPHLEGFLYPDTYQISAETISPEFVVEIMLQRFEQVALPVYQEASNPDLSLLDWVTLASIVEKESVVADERALIAGVFTQRLRQDIPLGADPTVEYGLGVTQTPENPLTYAQVETPSPYNTYLNPGLPPTPIASPGLASLEATLTPEETDYLFFVARYDGTHIFSRTLAEHEAAQARIRANLEAQSEASPAAPSN
ncbi:endolytic transglycosylase MltG [filamentous cyanobacterium CCP5]|nr:endolytic transglycosylase MltG [filamentous cyanobacterium CCP5]